MAIDHERRAAAAALRLVDRVPLRAPRSHPR